MFAIVLTFVTGMIEQFTSYFSADVALLLLLLATTFLSVALHFVVIIKTSDTRYSSFLEGLFRLPLYCLYLFLVGCIGISVEHSVQITLPVLNLFIAYLVAGEVFAVINYLRQLNVKVPSLLVFLATDLRNKIESRIGSNTTVPETPAEAPQEAPKEKGNE